MRTTWFLFLSSLPMLVSAQPVSQVFNASGTWVCPAGYSANITVQAWGGGGGGRNGGGREGGGGGGAYATATFNVVEGSYAVTVGAGGAPGVAGGISSFETTVIAAGGGSGFGNAGALGGSAAACTPLLGAFSGGNGGTIAVPGGGGGGGGSATSIANGGNGGNASNPTGGLGGIGEGNGGNGGNNRGSGINGFAPGGGGGGKGGGQGISGSGAAGRVIVTVNAFILPVELRSFNARTAQTGVELRWVTASERNNEKFVIERSADGRTFQEIGTVRGAGDAQTEQRYLFMDERPVRGLNYYRLKQVDFNRDFEYSPVRSAMYGRRDRLTAAPSPASDQVQIRLEEAAPEDAPWKVFDATGRLVRSGVWQAETDLLELEIADIPAGIYTFRLENGQQGAVKQFQKQ